MSAPKHLLHNALAAPSKRARATAPQWCTQLDREGYAVIENVLPSDECAQLVARIDAHMLRAGVDLRARRRDWPSIHSIMQHLEVAHMAPVWDIRCDRRVIAPFAQLYGSEQLLTSFDGICVMRPWDKVCGDKLAHSWLHTDQSFRKIGRHCIQGYINLTTSHDARSGSLAVVPRSHDMHAAFGCAYPSAVGPKDWYKFANDAERAKIALPGQKLTRVHGGVGSLVLWDSRTAHQNLQRDATLSRDDSRFRYVVYVCYQPRQWCTARNLVKKAVAFDNYRMTSHWPASVIRLFPQSWRTYGQPQPTFTLVEARDRVESDTMLRLAGKKNYKGVFPPRLRPLLPFSV